MHTPVLEGVLTYRTIVVFGDGEIREQEWNTKSSFIRQRTIYADGQWQLGYTDKNHLACGYKVTYFTDGLVYWGEQYEDKWHGMRVDCYTDGRREIGEVFKNSKFGDWKVVEKDGTERMDKF